MLKEVLDIVRWLLTLIVGGTIGGGIAFAWQRKHWLFQQRFARLYETYQAQIGITREIFDLVDKRIYASRAYVTALRSRDEGIISEERTQYKKVVVEWNEKSSGLVAILRSKFGRKLAYRFDVYFLPEFSALDQNLRNMRRSIEKGKEIDSSQFNIFDSVLDRINGEGRVFMNELLSRSEHNKDIVEEKPRISIDNIDNLYLTYLVKSLFKPRKQV